MRLNKSHNKIHTDGLVDYLALEYEGTVYLTVVGHELLARKRFLRRPKLERVPTTITTIPIKSDMVFLLAHFVSLDPVGEETHFDETVPTYLSFDEYMAKEIKDEFQAIFKMATDGNKTIDFTLTPKNKVARGFTTSGYFNYIVDLQSTLQRSYVVYRTTKFGILQIARINEIGNYYDTDNTITTGVDSVILDREVAIKLLDIMGINDSEDNAEERK